MIALELETYRRKVDLKDDTVVAPTGCGLSVQQLALRHTWHRGLRAAHHDGMPPLPGIRAAGDAGVWGNELTNEPH